MAMKITRAVGETQILFATEPQLSVGCVVPASLGVADANGKKVAKAGTPIKVDFANLQTAVSSAATGNNAVLLHDVDVTSGNNNGTALICGYVNINRLESTVQAKVTAGTKIGDVQFIKG
jgi:hypothetical protein